MAPLPENPRELQLCPVDRSRVQRHYELAADVTITRGVGIWQEAIGHCQTPGWRLDTKIRVKCLCHSDEETRIVSAKRANLFHDGERMTGWHTCGNGFCGDTFIIGLMIGKVSSLRQFFNFFISFLFICKMKERKRRNRKGCPIKQMKE